MGYDFDALTARRGTASVKWDEYGENALPMWVADMDFRAAPAILDALQKRLDHGVFGYELLPQAYYDAITGWFARRHGWTGFGKADIIPTTGVIPAYSACIKAMSSPGDKVIIQSPCYNAFYPAIRNNKCLESHNTLVWDGTACTIDFDDLERKAADPRATVLLLCNPHNPAGRVWTRAELGRIGDICLRNGVFIISDEIHCELTYPGHDYTPFGTLPPEIRRRYLKQAKKESKSNKRKNVLPIHCSNIIRQKKGRKKNIRYISKSRHCRSSFHRRFIPYSIFGSLWLLRLFRVFIRLKS